MPEASKRHTVRQRSLTTRRGLISLLHHMADSSLALSGWARPIVFSWPEGFLEAQWGKCHLVWAQMLPV